jgi:hypothetical protein
MNKYRLSIIIGLLTGFVSYAQNPKFALFESSPMLVNPAYTGYYPGKIRVSAHGSMMSTDVEKNLHTNTSVELRSNYDETDPLPRKYAAVGLNFYRYGHSSTPLSGMFPSLSVAYHTHIDRRRRHGVSAGLQVAYAMGRYDATGIGIARNPDYEISGGGFVPKGGAPGNLSASLNYVDVSVGGLYTYKTRDFELEAGLAMYHLFYPATDIFKKDLETKQRHRGVGSLKLGFELNQSKQLLFKTMYWRDGLFWLSSSLEDTTGEYTIGGLKAHFWLGIEMINKPLQERDLVLSYGLYTRSIATIMPLVELAYKKNYILRGTYEYPMNSRRFDAYRARRFELALVMYLNPRGKVVPFTED